VRHRALLANFKFARDLVVFRILVSVELVEEDTASNESLTNGGKQLEQQRP
jgi:hypothetical protein